MLEFDTGLKNPVYLPSLQWSARSSAMSPSFHDSGHSVTGGSLPAVQHHLVTSPGCSGLSWGHLFYISNSRAAQAAIVAVNSITIPFSAFRKQFLVRNITPASIQNNSLFTKSVKEKLSRVWSAFFLNLDQIAFEIPRPLCAYSWVLHYKHNVVINFPFENIYQKNPTKLLWQFISPRECVFPSVRTLLFFFFCNWRSQTGVSTGECPPRRACPPSAGCQWGRSNCRWTLRSSPSSSPASPAAPPSPPAWGCRGSRSPPCVAPPSDVAEEIKRGGKTSKNCRKSNADFLSPDGISLICFLSDFGHSGFGWNFRMHLKCIITFPGELNLIFSNCWVFQYLLHNVLLSNKVIKRKNHKKSLIHESTT